VIGFGHHLTDDRLYECYFASRVGEPVAPPLAEHLADCSACHQRYAAVEATLDATRDAGEAEADEIFTIERRQQQHDQIMRRLEQMNRSARVISFPGQAPGASSPESQRRLVSRWVAASAAAGLFVGVALGGWLSGARDAAAVARTRQAPIAAARVAPVIPAPAPTATVAPDKFDDEALLRQLESALANPRVRELQPFDVLTPHVREISLR
jgi:anti-sigma factor RsiW